MHHHTDRITHTTAFVTPVVEHWLEREIAQWVHHEGTIRRPIVPWAKVLTTELHLVRIFLENGIYLTWWSVATSDCINLYFISHYSLWRIIKIKLLYFQHKPVLLKSLFSDVYSYFTLSYLYKIDHNMYCLMYI